MKLNLGVHQSHGYMVYPGRCPKNSAIFLRPICWKQPHKQCCPRNSAILLRSFLSRACAQKTAPFCYGRFVGSNLTSNAVRETAPFCYGRFFPGHVPKKQRHFVTADLLEVTSQALLSEKQRHFVTVVSFQGMCPKNSAILLRPICGKQPRKLAFPHPTLDHKPRPN